jgi:hypothetical protein
VQYMPQMEYPTGVNSEVTIGEVEFYLLWER